MLLRKHITVLIFGFGSLLFWQGCNSSHTVYKETFTIANQQWHKDSVAVFEFEIKDTTKLYNLYILLGNTNNYPRSNIWLFVTGSGKAGQSFRDTFEQRIAEPSGKWIGDKHGETWQSKIRYKQMLVKKPGKYTFSLQQGMRYDQLPGVTEIGFQVEMARVAEKNSSEK